MQPETNSSSGEIKNEREDVHTSMPACHLKSLQELSSVNTTFSQQFKPQRRDHCLFSLKLHN